MSEDPLPFLYPEIETHASGYLEVDHGHRLWWEASGDPSGIAVIFVHGGPGAPSAPRHRRWFDPGAFNFVTIHQRGCGRSTPNAETAANTTQHLIADLEALREHLGIARWLVVGGSWGSILSLAYGQAHPDRCLGFVLTGVTLAREGEGDWWWTGTRRLFPEAFDRFIAALPEKLRDDPKQGCHRLLMDSDPAVCLPVAKALCLFSAATVTVEPNPEIVARYEDPAVTLPLARLFLHYNVNRYFLAPGQLLHELARIEHLPCALVGGRYDVTTPVDAAWALHRRWPGSSLEIVPGGAHGLSEPAMAQAFFDAVETMKGRI